MTALQTVDDVTTSVRNGVGRIVLARPRAMNALNHAMVARVHGALEAWRDDDEVHVVVIDGEGDRGLCAGGDIKMFHRSASADGSEATAFFRAEYRMNLAIARYPKPVVALMFGAVLGGGVGLSSHARHRLVESGAVVGMPEVGIGFFPDVGGTWLLARAPRNTGLYAALTGLPLAAADAVRCRLADAVVPMSVLEDVRAAEDDGAVLAIVAESTGGGSGAAPSGVLAGREHWIEECFSAPTVQQILSRLGQVAGADAADAAETADVIATRSPEAVVLTLLAVRRARSLPSLETALDLEFALATESLRRPDFVEGIRAQVIDKDRNPRWRPASFDEVDASALAAWIDSRAGAPVPGAPSLEDEH